MNGVVEPKYGINETYAEQEFDKLSNILKGVGTLKDFDPNRSPDFVKELLKGVDKTLYPNIADYINKQTFLALVPESFTVIPEYYKLYPESRPAFDPDPFALSRGRLTISQMIYLVDNKMPFEIIKEEDLRTILIHLVAYICWLSGFKMKDKEISGYLDKAMVFEKLVERWYRKYLIRCEVNGAEIIEGFSKLHLTLKKFAELT